ncbi:MAG: hypothetical protein ACQEP7_07200 [bacterium]
MDRKTKRWAIIIIDLFIVCGFYLAFTYFQGTIFTQAEGDTEFTTRVSQRQINYEIEGKYTAGKQVSMTLNLQNTTDSSRQINLPEGITLLLTDGKKNMYENKIMSSTTIQLAGGETRSWKRTFNVPPEIKNNMMAGFFIDESRQKLVEVRR